MDTVKYAGYISEHQANLDFWPIRTSEIEFQTNTNFRQIQSSDEYEPQRSEYELRKSKYKHQKSNFRQIRTSNEYEPQEIRIQTLNIGIRTSEIELQTNTNFRWIRTTRDSNPNVENRNTNIRNRTSDAHELLTNTKLIWTRTSEIRIGTSKIGIQTSEIRVLSSEIRVTLQMSLHELLTSNPHLKCFRHTTQSGLFGRVIHL